MGLSESAATPYDGGHDEDAARLPVLPGSGLGDGDAVELRSSGGDGADASGDAASDPLAVEPTLPGRDAPVSRVASAAYPHADVILRVLASEATTPEPDSWGGDWAAARDEVYKFVAERDRLRAEVADLKKRLGYPEFAR